MSKFPNPLAALIVSEPDPAISKKRVREYAREAWNTNRFFGIYADDPTLNPIERQVIEAVGRRVYGR